MTNTGQAERSLLDFQNSAAGKQTDATAQLQAHAACQAKRRLTQREDLGREGGTLAQTGDHQATEDYC